MWSAGKVAGHILMPSGASTPGAKPLSHIEAMEARGELAKAAAAYQAEIASDPGDVASCERLALLALRQLRDYELAAWAYREAERRADSPARKFGFGASRYFSRVRSTIADGSSGPGGRLSHARVSR